MVIALRFHTITDPELRTQHLSAEVIRITDAEPETIMAGPLGLIRQWLDAKGFRYVEGSNGIWRAAA